LLSGVSSPAKHDAMTVDLFETRIIHSMARRNYLGEEIHVLIKATSVMLAKD